MASSDSHDFHSRMVDAEDCVTFNELDEGYIPTRGKMTLDGIDWFPAGSSSIGLSSPDDGSDSSDNADSVIVLIGLERQGGFYVKLSPTMARSWAKYLTDAAEFVEANAKRMADELIRRAAQGDAS